MIYEIIDRELKKQGLVQAPSVVLKPMSINILDVAEHAIQRFKDRNATKEMAQHYIDTALVMIKESKDKYEFIAEDGSSVILEYGKLLTVIPKSSYTEKQIKKVQVILSCLELYRM